VKNRRSSQRMGREDNGEAEKEEQEEGGSFIS
jgi:hypothetical protein